MKYQYIFKYLEFHAGYDLEYGIGVWVITGYDNNHSWPVVSGTLEELNTACFHLVEQENYQYYH
jgi:hypothetical protein